MYIRLIRNEPKGSAITGRLVINGHWFCYTLERVGYQIPPLNYHVAVTMSPKFRRLLPIVQNVPQRSGIRFHVGKLPKHSTGCILVVADIPSRGRDIDCRGMLSQLSSKSNTPLSSIKTPPVGCRSSADIEQSLTQLLLQAQQAHEEIILEVNDFRPGTELGYNTSCPPELQKNK